MSSSWTWHSRMPCQEKARVPCKTGRPSCSLIFNLANDCKPRETAGCECQQCRSEKLQSRSVTATIWGLCKITSPENSPSAALPPPNPPPFAPILVLMHTSIYTQVITTFRSMLSVTALARLFRAHSGKLLPCLSPEIRNTKLNILARRPMPT